MKQLFALILILGILCTAVACSPNSNPNPTQNHNEIVESTRREAKYTGTFAIDYQKVTFAPDATIREILNLAASTIEYDESIKNGTVEIYIWNNERNSIASFPIDSLDQKVPEVVWFQSKQGNYDTMLLQLKNSTSSISMEMKVIWGESTETVRLSFDSLKSAACRYDGDWRICDLRLQVL